MAQKDYLILHGASIYTENAVLNDSAIVIKNGCIEAIVPTESINSYSAKKINFPANFSFVPGFIDMHVHGAQGCDVMDASFDALAEISQSLAAEGTTAYLATTMTASVMEIENVLCHVRDYVKRQHQLIGATVLGVHLEGPFLSPDKVGAQRHDVLLQPDMELIERWQTISNQIIKLITLAPELQKSHEFIRYLKRNNIIAAFGHTNATYAETMNSIEAGCTHATHLFNAMRAIHQREPGPVTAALLSDEVMAELIVDGVHLHPAIVQLILKLKRAEKCILVTDAMRATCLSDGMYDLGGQEVSVKQGIATLADGTLAGSTLKMSEAILNLLRFTQCSLSDVIKMTSENPAKSLGIFHKKGSLAQGKDADIVVMDDNYRVVMTLVSGKIVEKQMNRCTSS